MIKKLYFILAIVCFSQSAFAANFTATVDKNNVAVNDIITLKLILEDINTNDNVDLSDLKNDFEIRGTSQSSSLSVINGSYSRNRSWNISIKPKTQGILTIPSFTISSKAGKMKTTPIEITVGKAVSQNEKIKIINTVSKNNPYVNESIIYKVQIISKINIADPNLQIPKSDDFIIEQSGEVKQYQKVDNGIPSSINEITYILTPLKSGSIILNPASLDGDMEVEGGRGSQFFGRRFGLFNDVQYQSFSVLAEAINLNVQPIKTSLDQWLPLYSLEVSENWLDAKKAQVGEPINRTITIKAVGSKGSGLPDVEYMESNKQYKIYADKPNVKESTAASGLPATSKSIAYAIIPQKSGEIVIPPIKIAWWDVNRKSLKYATLPEKTIKVKESENVNEAKNIVENHNSDLELRNNIVEQSPVVKKSDKISNILLGILVTILIGAISYIVILRRKVSRANNPQGDVVQVSVKNISTAIDLESLFKSLGSYCHKNFKMANNSSLEDIKEYLKNNANYDPKEIEILFESISKALYAGNKIDLGDCKKKLSQILKSINSRNIVVNKSKSLNLNP